MSANQWAKAIKIALQKKAEKVPEGWKTRKQLEEVFESSQKATCEKINILKKAGLVEQRRFKIVTNRGLFPEIHYKIIEK